MSIRRAWQALFAHPRPEGAEKAGSRPRKFLTLRVKELRFFGEQDGPVERELKQRWIPILESNKNVRRAYLARVGYGEKTQETSVALCLRSDKEDKRLVREMVAVFVPMAPKSAHLDVMFIDEDQESRLAPLCAPFFGGFP